MPNPYSDEEDDDSSPSEAENDSTDREEDGDESDFGTALIPKSILGGKKCKPGEKLNFEVVHVYGDEIEVKFVKYNKDKEDKEEDSDQMRESMSRMEESYS